MGDVAQLEREMGTEKWIPLLGQEGWLRHQ